MPSVSVSSAVITPALPMVAMKAKASGIPPKLASTPEAVSTSRRSSRSAPGPQDRHRQGQPEDGAEHGGDHRQLQAAQVRPPVGALGDGDDRAGRPGLLEGDRVGGPERLHRQHADGQQQEDRDVEEERQRAEREQRAAAPAPAYEGPARPCRAWPVLSRTSPRSSGRRRPSAPPSAGPGSGTRRCPRPRAAPSGPSASAVPAFFIASQPDRAGEALEPDVLALVAVEELLPEPGRGRVRRELADRLAVEAAEQAVGRAR